MKIAKLFKITGRVQGVGYRYFCYNNALKLNIYGYTKNLADLSVECLAIGEKDDIEKYYSILLKGPAMSNVLNIYVENIDKDKFKYNSFSINY